MKNVIGREKEIKELNKLYDSSLPQFVAVYGRRRVGKTFLIDQTFKNRITFRHAGLSPVDYQQKNLLKDQLKSFYYSLISQGMKKSKCPASWLEAFFMLEMHLQSIDNGSRQVVFLDELPWLDTPRSGFITALESFWNGWGCHRDNFMLIVCGSATSWIVDNLINNHGGLYGRLTSEIKLSPFTLKECEQFYQNKQIKLSRYDIVQSYMALGGIPYYLSYFDSGQSLAQNIDNLFFVKNAKLHDEFDRLFASVFSRPEEIKKIVKLLSKRHSGYMFEEIAQKTGITSGGSLSNMLKALIASDFVLRYVPFGCSKREVHYKLVDPFCIFYLRYVPENSNYVTSFWQQNQASQSVVSWRGIAFEEICLLHIDQIKKALGIMGVSTQQSSWALRGNDEEEGTQVDLIIQRADHIVNLCEMKFYGEDFTVDKSYHQKIDHREKVLTERLSRKETVHPVLITTYGVTYNEYSGIFQNVIIIDQLFE